MEYPIWICGPCGQALGNWTPAQMEGRCRTVHKGVCGVCGNEAMVTEPRDFGHLRKGWERIAASMLPWPSDEQILADLKDIDKST